MRDGDFRAEAVRAALQEEPHGVADTARNQEVGQPILGGVAPGAEARRSRA